MKLYYAEICDHEGTPVIRTKYYPSNRQAGAVGKQIADYIPPAASYNVRLAIFDAQRIADMASLLGEEYIEQRFEGV